MAKRRLTGSVVSDKMEKTLVVRVDRIKKYPKYQARFRFSRQYKAHDTTGQYRVGDRVVIEECRPRSKDKKWRVLKKLG